MSSKQQFIKNTNVPEEQSPLWQVSEGWKIATGSGKTYTDLDDIFRDEKDPQNPVNDLYNALIDQLEGRITEPIDYIGYLFVATVAKDLQKELVYAYKPTEINAANTAAKYSYKPESPRNSGKSVSKGPVAQVQTQFKPQSTSGPAASSTVQTTSKPAVVQRTIEVVTDVTPIEWNDAPGIEDAQNRGLYILPVDKVGAINFNFEGKDGVRTFLYGRIINVKIGDN